MMRKRTTEYSFIREGISIVIPAYNAQDWIIPTTQKIVTAVNNARLKNAEIIIVNDGSSDNTERIARDLKYDVPVRVYSHANAGRFLTRKKGVVNARYETILFIDTRVWIDEQALVYVLGQQKENPERRVWNGDVQVHKKGNIIARFGDAITQIGWRRYHGNPRLLSYGIKDFDYYPKGTTIFLAPKQLIQDAILWFESQTNDIRNSSDDTLLIRYIAERERIWISPGFTSTYFARTTIKAFIGHTYHRGMFFVDGFLRKGTRFYYPLIIFLVGTLMSLILSVFFPILLLYIGIVLCLCWLLELITALILGISLRDSLSLFVLSPLFAVVYGLGIWRATITRMKNV